MSTRRLRLFLSALLASVVLAASTALAADEYAVDPNHAAATFKVSHLGLSWTYGRFKDVSGSFVIDADNPAGTRFELSTKIESLSTDNAKRDEHLRSPDFFNAKQYPAITFKSTGAKVVKNGYEVTGNLTLHGVTKPVTMTLVGGRTAEFPKGVRRTGYSGDLAIKRSEFGMDKATEAIGDEVFIAVSFEGTKK